MRVCASCGQENPDGFKFCGNCGAPLAEAEPARELRKTVTVLFCDLTGSTALGDVTDPEALRATMRGYYDEMRTILERHGGTVEKFIGDAVMAVFGVPVSHEDDALRAVRAAWEMRAAVPALGLRARIGVNTGEVVAGEGDSLVTGDAVNVAARLEQAAEPGDVLIGAETRQLVRGAVEVEPVEVTAKGKPQPVRAFRLVDVDLDAAAIARRLDTPLVGRRTELDQLRQAFDRTVREQRCHLFTLLGAAGVGKSRLVAEFLSSVDATVLRGRCLDYGEGITFWPVISILKQLGARGEETLAHVVEGASTANELFWSVRTLLEEVAADRPLVVLFDDIHWGEETFLDLIDHVADLSRGAPILVLCVARPDLLDKRPGWGGGKLNATTTLLAPLSADECVELIEAHGGVDAVTRTRILSAADGNPLFVEEMVAFAREDGDVTIPSTVQALLQARLDQLGREERSVIERGAVEGNVFHRGAVLELSRSTDVEPLLVGLVRKELIQPARSTFSGDHAFQFRHLLIRDAAYDALPKETRADLHERFAAWLEEHGQDLIELDEVLGYHLEQAARYRRELGRASAETERAAARRLAAAGARAAGRSDAHGAGNLLGRALALMPPDDPERGPALLNLVVVLESSPQVGDRQSVLEELESSRDPVLRMHGRVARLQYRLLAEPGEVIPEAEAAVQEALGVFEAANDHAGRAQAHYLAAWVSWLGSRALPTAEALERAVAHARISGIPGLVARGTVMSLGTLNHGPFTPDEIERRLEPLRRDDSQLARHAVLYVSANLAYRAGDIERSLDLQAKASEIASALGLDVAAAAGQMQAGETEIGGRRLDEAAQRYRRTDVQLEALGQTSFRSTLQIWLGRVLYLQGDLDEAGRLAILGEEMGDADDVVNFAWGGALRARIAADRGRHEEAEAIARNAVEYAYRTDFPRVRADAHAALAHVLRAQGRTEEARAEQQQAVDLFERHGYTIETADERKLLVEL